MMKTLATKLHETEHPEQKGKKEVQRDKTPKQKAEKQKPKGTNYVHLT